jgi:putative ABC transport system ATP-binding protein
VELNPVAVHCRGITKSYRAGGTETKALRGVDLDILFGELLMLVGPSGSGKTTLLSIIAGILDRDGGECTVLEHDFQQLPAAERARLRGRSIGFVFQSFNLLPAITATENVSIPLLINGMPRKEAVIRARGVLDGIGLAGRGDAPPGQLSGGQQQRVAIARAIVHQPRLIVCDEPTSNLDHATGREVMELLKRQAEAPDRAIVVVTHDPRIIEFADRIAHIDDGRIVEISSGGGREAGS